MATKDVKVPDIGDFDEVPVIEILVKSGDEIEKEQSLITLESEKATMEVPAPFGGKVKEVKVEEGDSVSEGDVILTVEAEGEEGDEDKDKEEGEAEDADRERDEEGEKEDEGKDEGEEGEKAEPRTKDKGKDKDADEEEHEEEAESKQKKDEEEKKAKKEKGKKKEEDAAEESKEKAKDRESEAREDDAKSPADLPHASPSVRRFARELGVDLSQVEGSGRKGRITQDDVQQHVKQVMQGAGAKAGAGLDIAAPPKVDFERFGEVEVEPLSRIRRIGGRNLHRNWVTIPHVTQHDEADVTDLEAFRQAHQEEANARDAKLTLIAFLIKASVAALKRYPRFNSSLDESGERLIMKRYFHIGVAVDTENGLVVPVIRNCDQKGLVDLAVELVETARKARDGKLSPGDMQGACFSISSLGGIGGTGFTPIVNLPEVAILGVSRSATKPMWNGDEFEPRLMLPLSLSYDHRVVDGADAARFTRYLAEVLGDLRRVLL